MIHENLPHEKVKSRMANLPMDKRKELKLMCSTGFNFVLNMEVFLGMSGAGASPLAYLLWAAELKGIKLVRGGCEGGGVYLQAHHTEYPIRQSGLPKCDCTEKEETDPDRLYPKIDWMPYTKERPPPPF